VPPFHHSYIIYRVCEGRYSDIQYVLSGTVHEFGMGTRFANLLEVRTALLCPSRRNLTQVICPSDVKVANRTIAISGGR
jgi:hypothetical protein